MARENELDLSYLIAHGDSSDSAAIGDGVSATLGAFIADIKSHPKALNTRAMITLIIYV
jgi:hypothetical protein